MSVDSVNGKTGVVTLIADDIPDAVSKVDLASAEGAGLVGFIQDVPGAYVRDLLGKAREIGVTPQDFPGETNEQKIVAWQDHGDALPAGAYAMTRQVTVAGLRSLRLLGDVTLDFSSATDATKFPDGTCFLARGGDLEAIPNLSVDATKGASSLTFASAPDVQRGDVLLIYNPVDFSFSGFRAEYRAGEFVPVDSVAGSVVRIFGSLYDNYAAAIVSVYRLPRTSFTLSGGRLRVIGSTAPGMASISAVRVENHSKVVLDNLTATGSLYASLAIERCYDVSGTGVVAEQAKDVATGTDYGLIIGNSQKVRISGTFYGGRHAVTTGGNNSVGCVPNRDVMISGSGANASSAAGGIAAIDCHGNTEYCTFDGLWDGGFGGGGNHITVRGTLIAKANQNGIAVYFGEMLGTDFDFSGVRITAAGDPTALSNRGVIDIGGDSAALNAHTTHGGTLNFSGVTVDAPNAARGLLFANRGCTTMEPIVLLTQGMTFNRLSACPAYAILINAPSGGGKAINVLDLRGMTMPAVTYTVAPIGINVSGVSKVRGWSRTGTATGTALTSAATLAIPVIFDMPFPLAPKIAISLDVGRLGGQAFGVNVTSVSTIGFTITIYTIDGTNFNGARAFAPAWTATLEQ